MGRNKERIFDIGTDPFCTGRRIYQRKSFNIKPGVTVLVGCNGAGKTTLLKCIKSKLKMNKIPIISFDSFESGKETQISTILFSEGETIVHNLGIFVSKLKKFDSTGYIKENPFEDIFLNDDESNKKKEELSSFDERWILLDATDSGLSIDNIIELKSLFKLILEYSNKTTYILISANEYEMTIDEDCLDVQSSKYTRFSTYDEYKKFIIKSREKKDKSLERQRSKKGEKK